MANLSKPDLPAEVQARVDFVRSVVPKKKIVTPGKVAALVILLVLFSAIVWLVWPGAAKPLKSVGLSNPKPPLAINLNPAIPTLSYSSKFFNMAFNYPKGWTLKDNGKGLLEVMSPLSRLVSANGTTQKGYIIFSTVPSNQFPAGLTAGTDLAVLDSNIANYTNPASDQAGQTYISFVQYPSTNVKGGLDAVIVSGNVGYQKDQVISPSDLSGLNPLIYISFTDCMNALCTKQSPLTIASSSWSSTPLNQVITNIIKSLVFN